MRQTALGIAAVLVLATASAPADARAERRSNHVGAAGGGAVAGLICGGATLTYSRIRAATSANPPLLWHGDSGAGWIGVFFVEHGVVGGMTGAFGRSPPEGFVIGGLITCGLDLLYLIASEIIAATDEPALAAFELTPGGLRLCLPPITLRRRSAHLSLFAWRF